MTPAGPFIISNDKKGALQKKLHAISLELASIDVFLWKCLHYVPSTEHWMSGDAGTEVWRKYELYIKI